MPQFTAHDRRILQLETTLANVSTLLASALTEEEHGFTADLQAAHDNIARLLDEVAEYNDQWEEAI